MYRLDDNLDFSFSLLALLSSAKPHKLAWRLNETLNLQLQRDTDVLLHTQEDAEAIFIRFMHRTDYTILYLLRNKSTDNNKQISYLLPELSQYDYLLLVDDQTEEYDILNIQGALRELNIIEHQLLVEASKLKNKYNLMFYFE